MGLLGKAKFKDVLKDFAAALEWDDSNINADSAVFEFETDSGQEHTLYAMQQEDIVEFDIPSVAVFKKENQVPHKASTILLQRNAELAVGAWVLEEIEDEWCYSLMWNEGLESLATMSHDDFESNVGLMIEEVDAFNQIWEDGKF